MEAPRVVVTVLNLEDIVTSEERGETATWKVAVEYPEMLGTSFAKQLLLSAAESMPEDQELDDPDMRDFGENPL